MVDFNKYLENPKKHTPENIKEDELVSIHESMVANYDFGEPNSARAVREAKENGLVVVYPEDNQLQIDIDSDRAFGIFLEMKHLLERYFVVTNVTVSYSRSGHPKRHVTVTLAQPINDYQRIALQTLMGSDRVREFLSYIQLRQNDPHPILFIEKPGLQPTRNS